MSDSVALVLPTGSYRTAAFLSAAARLDIDLVLVTDEPSTLAGLRPGHEVVVEMARPERAAELAASLPGADRIGAVVPADESSVLVAAQIAAGLGLPGNPLPAAAATRNKGLLRRALAAAGLPQPRFTLWETGAAPAVRFPVVVKPLELSGSRGVIRADSKEQLEHAGVRVQGLLRAARCRPGLLVEEFVPGPEVALEGLLLEGELRVLAVFDKPEPLDGPYFEETVYTVPSELAQGVQGQLAALVQQAVSALGLRSGAVHCELRLGGGQPQLIDLASRSIGGRCSGALRFGSGRSLEELILMAALGRTLPQLGLAPGARGVLMIPIPGAGRLAEVRGLELARSAPGITGLELTVAPGSLLVPLPEGDRYLGFIFAEGGSAAEVRSALGDAHRLLEVRLTA